MSFSVKTIIFIFIMSVLFFFDINLKPISEAMAGDSGGTPVGTGGMGMGFGANGADPDSSLRMMYYSMVNQDITLLATNVKTKAASEIYNLLVPIHPMFENEDSRKQYAIAGKVVFDSLASNITQATQHKLMKNAEGKASIPNEGFQAPMQTMASQDVIFKNNKTWKETVLWLRKKLSPEQYQAIQNEVSVMIPCDSNSKEQYPALCSYNLSEIKIRSADDPYRKELEVFFMPLDEKALKNFRPEWAPAADKKIEEIRENFKKMIESAPPISYEPPPPPQSTAANIASPAKTANCPLSERPDFLKFLEFIKVNPKDCITYSESLFNSCPTMVVSIRKRSDVDWELCRGNYLVGKGKVAITQDDFNQAIAKKKIQTSAPSPSAQKMEGIK